MQWYARWSSSSSRRWGTDVKPLQSVGAWAKGVRRDGRRAYATRDSGGQKEDWETVEVRCGGSGNITVDLLHSSRLSQPSTPLILYLPPTGTHLRLSHPPLPSILLNPPIPATIARINYRWNIPSSSIQTPHYKIPLFDSKRHPFPIPVHDVLTAYEWLINVYLPQYSTHSPPSSPESPDSDSRSAASRAASTSARRGASSSPGRDLYAQSTSSPRKIIQRPLFIYGDFLGATLATSLALTESFSSKQTPTRIDGLIAKDGVYDWIDIASSVPPSQDQPPPATLNKSSGLAADGNLLSPPPSPSSSTSIGEPKTTDESSAVEWRANDTVWDKDHLFSLRQTLFSTPSQAFDPFASPTQFFRTAGVAVPPFFPTTSPHTPPPSPSHDAFSALLPGSQGDFFSDIEHEPTSPRATPSIQSSSISSLPVVHDVPRQSHLKYPPSASGLTIPRSLFLYSLDHPSSSLPSEASKPARRKKSFSKPAKHESTTSASQAADIATLMRRSIVKHEFKPEGHEDSDLAPHEEAENRIQLLCSSPSPATEPSSSPENPENPELAIREWLEESLG